MQNSGLKVNARDDILKIPAEHLIQIIPRRKGYDVHSKSTLHRGDTFISRTGPRLFLRPIIFINTPAYRHFDPYAYAKWHFICNKYLWLAGGQNDLHHEIIANLKNGTATFAFNIISLHFLFLCFRLHNLLNALACLITAIPLIR
jgi:hypothetical protein